MRAKSVALLVLALGCGVVASIGITQVMAKRGGEPAASPGETETVFVALEDIALGDILEPQLLRVEQWPNDKIPEGVLIKIEDVEGRRTRTKLYSGEPILENKLYPKGEGGQGATARIPKGYRVVPVRVDLVSGASGMILPGDRVDVVIFVARNRSTGIVDSAIHTVLQDIKVFACNDIVEVDSTGDEAGNSIRAQTISLLVTPEQAKKVMLASELGKIRLVMRSPDDDEPADDNVVTADDLFRLGSESSNRTEDSPSEQEKPDEAAGNTFGEFLERMRAGAVVAQSAAPNLPAPHKHGMRIVSGPEVRDVVLEADGSESESHLGPWRVNDAGAVRGVAPTAKVPQFSLPVVPEEQEPTKEKD